MTKTVRRFTSVGAWIALIGCVGCMASIATRVDEPIPPVYLTDISVLAIMPGTVDDGSEWIRPYAMESLVTTLEDRLPGTVVIGPEESAARLAELSLAAEYAALLDDFDAAGVVDPDRVGVITDAIGATHLMTTRAGFEGKPLQRTTTNLDGSPIVYNTKRQTLYLVARLWEATHHAPSWEAVAHSRSQAGLFGRDRPPVDIVEALVDGLATRLTDSMFPATSAHSGSGSR